MNECESMVKANRYLIRGISIVFDPIVHVTAQGHEPLSNFMDGHAYVLLGASIFTSHFHVDRPFFYVAFGHTR